MTVPPIRAAVSLSARNSSSVPNSGSIAIEMRSKWPSTLGVGSQPLTPPASLTGPVWMASMPMVLNASHSSLEPIELRKDSPGLVMWDSG